MGRAFGPEPARLSVAPALRSLSSLHGEINRGLSRRRAAAHFERGVARLGAKYHLHVIHYQQAFDDAQMKAPANYWSWDGIHPTYAGHGLMAREWMRVTAAAWPN